MNINQIFNTALRIEIANIEADNIITNPYYDTIIQMDNGEALWEAFNILVESHFRHVERYNKLGRFANRVCKGYGNLKQIIERQSIEIDDLKQQLFGGKDDPDDDLPF